MIAASPRLILRYYQPEDVEPIFRHYTGDPGSTAYLARPVHAEIAQTKQMLNKLSNPESLASTGSCVWVVHSVEDRAAVGLITLVRDVHSTVIHFGIGVPYRGRGYAAEALALAARHLLVAEQAKSVTSFTDTENTAAQATLLNAGFICTGKADLFYRAPRFNSGLRKVLCYQFGH